MSQFLALENNISVIIPVFNASDFVSKAVESALMQREVGEVILIEDASKDNSLEICRQLQEKYEKVKLLTHPKNANRGAGESRNLGIKYALCDYIAFLDADDYFLPNRFRAERSIFKNDATADGVYGSMGFHYYSEEGKRKYNEQGYGEPVTIEGSISGQELLFSLLFLHPKYNGNFHLNTLTIKKEALLTKTPLFNSLVMHEYTSFLIPLTINCSIRAGVIDEPIVMYGVHDHNRIISNDPKNGSYIKQWKYLYDWSRTSEKGKQYSIIFHAFLAKEQLVLSKRFPGIFKMAWHCLRNPLFLRKSFFFRPVCIHLFGKYLGWYVINFKEQTQNKYFKDNSNSSVFDEMFIK